MSIRQHLEAFLKHVEDLRKTDGNSLDGYEKGFRVNMLTCLCVPGRGGLTRKRLFFGVRKLLGTTFNYPIFWVRVKGQC